jgi:hypothetical protein
MALAAFRPDVVDNFAPVYYREQKPLVGMRGLLQQRRHTKFSRPPAEIVQQCVGVQHMRLHLSSVS